MKTKPKFFFFSLFSYALLTVCITFFFLKEGKSQNPDLFNFDYQHTAIINEDTTVATAQGTFDVNAGTLTYDAQLSKNIQGYSYYMASAVTQSGNGGGPIVALEADGGLNLWSLTNGELNYRMIVITEDQFANIRTEIEVRLEGNTIITTLQSVGTADYPLIVGMDGPILMTQTPGNEGFTEKGVKRLIAEDGSIIESTFSTEYFGIDLPFPQVRNLSLTVLEESDDFRNVKIQMQNIVRPEEVEPTILPFEYTHNVNINGQSGIAKATGIINVNNGTVEYLGIIPQYIDGYRRWASSWLTTVLLSAGPVYALQLEGGQNILTLTQGELGHTVEVSTEDQFANINTFISVERRGDAIIAELNSEGSAAYPELAGMTGDLRMRQIPDPNGGFTESGVKQLVALDGSIIESHFTAKFSGVDLPGPQIREASLTVLEESDDFKNVLLRLESIVRPLEVSTVNAFGLEHRGLGNASLEKSDGKLVVSNLGNDGNDGIQINLNEGIGIRYFVDEAFDASSSPDRASFTITRTYTDSTGHVETSVESLVDIGEFLEVRTRLMGAPTRTIRVFNNGETIYELNNHDGPWDLRMALMPAATDCRRYDCDVTFYNFDADDIIVVTPDGSQIEADGFLIMPDEYVPMGTLQQTIKIETTNIPSFTINEEQLFPFGTLSNAVGHLALGEATFNAEGNALTVSSLGSEGSDGVEFQFPGFPGIEEVDFFAVDWRDITSPQLTPDGASLILSAVGEVDGDPNQFLGSATFIDTGEDLEVTADYSFVNSPTQRVEVFRNGEVIATLTGQSGVLVRLPDWPDRIGKQGGIGDVFDGRTKCITADWREPIPMTLASGQIVRGDRLGIFIENPNSTFGPLSSFRVQTTSIPSITIVRESISTISSTVSVDCPSEVPVNCPFETIIKAQIADQSDLLGSFSGTLTWDPNFLTFNGNQELLSGFTGLINVDDSGGTIKFNGTNIDGVGGLVDLFKVSFIANGPVGENASIGLEITAMAAAITLEDLSSSFTIFNCETSFINGGVLGDVNGDNLVNSSDALAILYFDVGLPLPTLIMQRIDEGFGDVNNDGSTNSRDASIILSYDVGFPISLPVGETFCKDNEMSNLQERNTVTNNLKNKVTEILVAPKPVSNQDEYVDVPVFVNLSKADYKLGSFTAEINWNPLDLELLEYTGSSNGIFDNPVINTNEMKKGILRISNADPEGAGGLVNIINLRFKKLNLNASPNIQFSFSSLATNQTFEKLTPLIENLESKLSEDGSLMAFPNPFNKSTQLTYSIPKTTNVNLFLTDQNGRIVNKLFNGTQAKGNYTFDWDGTDEHGKALPVGIYYIFLETEAFNHTFKLVYIP